MQDRYEVFKAARGRRYYVADVSTGTRQLVTGYFTRKGDATATAARYEAASTEEQDTVLARSMPHRYTAQGQN